MGVDERTGSPCRVHHQRGGRAGGRAPADTADLRTEGPRAATSHQRQHEAVLGGGHRPAATHPAAHPGGREPRRGKTDHGPRGGAAPRPREDRAGGGAPREPSHPDARRACQRGDRAARERLLTTLAPEAWLSNDVSLRPLKPGDLEALWAARMHSDEPWADPSEAGRRKLRD